MPMGRDQIVRPIPSSSWTRPRDRKNPYWRGVNSRNVTDWLIRPCQIFNPLLPRSGVCRRILTVRSSFPRSAPDLALPKRRLERHCEGSSTNGELLLELTQLNCRWLSGPTSQTVIRSRAMNNDLSAIPCAEDTEILLSVLRVIFECWSFQATAYPTPIGCKRHSPTSLPNSLLKTP